MIERAPEYVQTMLKCFREGYMSLVQKTWHMNMSRYISRGPYLEFNFTSIEGLKFVPNMIEHELRPISKKNLIP